jgi:hypothetical protein
MDYRKLLWKYMEHVGAMEGTTFVGSVSTGEHPDDFTEEEVKVLEVIDRMGGKYEH